MEIDTSLPVADSANHVLEVMGILATQAPGGSG
jgi:hypothetical protein